MFDPTKHNYYRKLMKLYAEGKLPPKSLTEVNIYHDNWCGIHRGRYCNCDPEIKLRGQGRRDELRPLNVFRPR